MVAVPRSGHSNRRQPRMRGVTAHCVSFVAHGEQGGRAPALGLVSAFCARGHSDLLWGRHSFSMNCEGT